MSGADFDYVLQGAKYQLMLLENELRLHGPQGDKKSALTKKMVDRERAKLVKAEKMMKDAMALVRSFGDDLDG